MKTNIVYKTLTILLLTVFSVTSCNDFLDVDPEGKITGDNFYITGKDAESAIISAYAHLRKWDMVGFSYVILQEITSDNALKGSSPGDASFINDFANFTVTASEGSLNGYWLARYQGIDLCNKVILNVPSIPLDINMDEEKKQQILGEAKFVRALLYFDLVRAFDAAGDAVRKQATILYRGTVTPSGDSILGDLILDGAPRPRYKGKAYVHTSTMVVGVKNNFERRVGIWAAGFDNEDNMYCNTAFGDYPHYIPAGETNHLKSRFTGWMLLNYKKPVQVSSTLGAHHANNLVNENVKTYWSAKTGAKGEYFISDLLESSTIHAIQINYADQDAEFLGKTLDKYHQYTVSYSNDGKKWTVLIDKRNNKKDVPHDYIELDKPIKARYLKMENIHVPSGKFAVSGFRVFGFGSGEKPETVQQFMVLRTETDKRSAWIRWQPVDGAYAYNIYVGVEPDKLYNCTMIHNANEYYYKAMDKDMPYYFAIEAINENGTSTRTRAEAK